MIWTILGWQPIRDREAEIIKMCKRAGLAHKDFARRNFVIRRDPATNEMMIDEQGKPRLLVVDWGSASS